MDFLGSLLAFTEEVLHRPREQVSFGTAGTDVVDFMYKYAWERLFLSISQVQGFQMRVRRVPRLQIYQHTLASISRQILTTNTDRIGPSLMDFSGAKAGYFNHQTLYGQGPYGMGLVIIHGHHQV